MTTITARNQTSRTVQFYVPGSGYMRIGPHASCTLERVDCQSPTLQKLVRERVLAVSDAVESRATEAVHAAPGTGVPDLATETTPGDAPPRAEAPSDESPQTTDKSQSRARARRETNTQSLKHGS
jgi:hypothetical protein